MCVLTLQRQDAYRQGRPCFCRVFNSICCLYFGQNQYKCTEHLKSTQKIKVKVRFQNPGKCESLFWSTLNVDVKILRISRVSESQLKPTRRQLPEIHPEKHSGDRETRPTLTPALTSGCYTESADQADNREEHAILSM